MITWLSNKIEWGKAIEINENFFRDIEELYKIVNKEPKYIIQTKDKVYYSFLNIKEIIEFKFEEEIIYLKIECECSDDLTIIVRPDYASFFLNYRTVSTAEYTVRDMDKALILNQNIKKMYNRYTVSNWIVGKIGLIAMIYALTILDIIILFIYRVITQNYNFNNLQFQDIAIIIMVMPVLFIIKKIDINICKKYFSPLITYMGYQKKIVDKNRQRRTNIFWGIIIAIVVGIITSIIGKTIGI